MGSPTRKGCVALCLLAFVMVLAPGAAHAAELEPVPRLEGRVTDIANVLSAADRERLAGILARYEQETFHQLAILTVPTLSGESIESFSLRVANSWGLGQKGLDNGVLIVLAIRERQVRIELGLGMQKFVSNATAQSLVNTAMVPYFRKADYAGGLESGLDQLMREARAFVVAPADVQRSK
jgi:uncharacterized protein